jgi:hypothetical protein
MPKLLTFMLLLISSICFSQNKSKKEILQSLVGTHPLNDISGLMGANSMIDYNKVNGKWKGYFSMNMGGMRNGEAIKIQPEALSRLNSMEIVVNPDLSIDFNCKKQTLFSVPFVENGMFLEMNKAYNENSPHDLFLMKSDLTIKNGNLYLFANDNIGSEKIEPLKFEYLESDALTVYLYYSINEKTFNLIHCDGEYDTGITTYSFKRRS